MGPFSNSVGSWLLVVQLLVFSRSSWGAEIEFIAAELAGRDWGETLAASPPRRGPQPLLSQTVRGSLLFRSQWSEELHG